MNRVTPCVVLVSGFSLLTCVVAEVNDVFLFLLNSIILCMCVCMGVCVCMSMCV